MKDNDGHTRVEAQNVAQHQPKFQLVNDDDADDDDDDHNDIDYIWIGNCSQESLQIEFLEKKVENFDQPAPPPFP